MFYVYIYIYIVYILHIISHAWLIVNDHVMLIDDHDLEKCDLLLE